MLDNIYLYSSIIKKKEYQHIFEYQKKSSLFDVAIGKPVPTRNP